MSTTTTTTAEHGHGGGGKGGALMKTTTTPTSPFKRVKLDVKQSDKVIGTHSGTFQADEAMGVFLLRQLPEYRNSPVLRSRDIPLLEEKADIIIDVGGIYNHETKRYDHHQRDYDERFDSKQSGKNDGVANQEPRCTKLSASGLVYRHYGKDVLKQYYPMLSEELLQVAYVKLYDKLMEALDANDTGVEMVPPGVTALYRDATTLPARVHRLNPRWNEVDETTGQPPDPDERFEQAVTLCGHDFCAVMTQIVEADLPALSLVEAVLLNRHAIDPSGEIIAFPSGGMPWRDHLYQLEKQHQIDPLIKFVLYQESPPGTMWRVQAVTVGGKAFENRKSLPQAWRGVRDQDLAALCQIRTARFVHAAGFIGGADEYDDALTMARIALQLEDEAEQTKN
ncbi:hypothetical protein ACA910_006680 [Epithemia clementina (nom. ined.)]